MYTTGTRSNSTKTSVLYRLRCKRSRNRVCVISNTLGWGVETDRILVSLNTPSRDELFCILTQMSQCCMGIEHTEPVSNVGEIHLTHRPCSISLVVYVREPWSGSNRVCSRNRISKPLNIIYTVRNVSRFWAYM